MSSRLSRRKTLPSPGTAAGAFDVLAVVTCFIEEDIIVDTVADLWDAGTVVVPLPQGVPSAWRQQILDVTLPEYVLGADGERRTIDGGQPAEDGDALIMATSGTSGTPKAVVLTHDALDAAAFASTIHLTVSQCDSSACLLLA